MTPYIRMHSAILERFAAGETVVQLADDFRLTQAETERVLQTASKALLLPKSKAQLGKLLAEYVPENQLQQNYEAIVFAGIYAYIKGYEMPGWVLDAYRQATKQIANASPDHSQPQ